MKKKVPIDQTVPDVPDVPIVPNVQIVQNVPTSSGTATTSRTFRTFKKSFGLLEVVIAVGIFAAFAGSMITVISLSSKNMVVNKHRLQAANLAREGIELVTEIRDTAWQYNVDWDTMWAVQSRTPQCWGLGFDNPKKLVTASPTGCGMDGINHWMLNTDINGEVINTPLPPNGDGITFTRFINTEDYNWDPNTKKVTVTVRWNDYGQTKNVTMVTLLTNWK